MKKFVYCVSDIILAILTCNFFVRKRIIRNYIGNKKFKKVLDAGCGTGTLASLFSQKQYYGIDVNKDLISYAREKHKGYKFEIGDLTKFSVKQKFDLILIVGVLHHLNDLEVDKFLNFIFNQSTKNAKIVIIEAIHDTRSWNFVSYILRYFDRGKYIRKTDIYRKSIMKKLKLIESYEVTEVFFCYAVFLASK